MLSKAKKRKKNSRERKKQQNFYLYWENEMNSIFPHKMVYYCLSHFVLSIVFFFFSSSIIIMFFESPVQLMSALIVVSTYSFCWYYISFILQYLCVHIRSSILIWASKWLYTGNVCAYSSLLHLFITFCLLSSHYHWNYKNSAQKIISKIKKWIFIWSRNHKWDCHVLLYVLFLYIRNRLPSKFCIKIEFRQQQLQHT